MKPDDADASRPVVEVRLSNLEVTDADIAALAGLPEIRSLDLEGARITDAGLGRLAGLTRLQALGLTGTRVTDDGLEHLKGMVDLKVLVLSKTAVTGSGLRHLAGATRLEELYLFESGVTDSGLKNVKSFKNLRHLNLWGTSITDAGLVHLAALVRLEHLELIGTAITDAGLVHLRPLVDLYDLNMSETLVTAGAARRLRQSLQDTQIVDGNNQSVDNADLRHRLGVMDVTRQKQSPLIERAMPKLTALLARSDDARRKVAGPLATVAKPPLFDSLNPADRSYQDQLRRDLAALSEGAVARSRRYAKPVRPSGTSVSFLPASRIVVAEFVFPPVAVTPTQEEGDLTIDYWICPDRTSALGLYWLRSGMISAVGYGRHSEVERAVAESLRRGGWFVPPKSAELVGESAYWLDPSLTSQLPSRGEDEAEDANRYSFLRGNVVVEIATPEYVRMRNGGKWIWMCELHMSNSQEFLRIARGIDQDLVRRGTHRLLEPPFP